MKIDYKLVDTPVRRRRPLRWIVAGIMLIAAPVVVTLAMTTRNVSHQGPDAPSPMIKDETLITLDSHTIAPTGERPAVNIKLVMPGAAKPAPVAESRIPASLGMKPLALTDAPALADAPSISEAIAPATETVALIAEPPVQEPLAEEAVTIAAPDPWNIVTVAKGDNLSKIFSQQGLSSREVYNLLALGDATATLKKIHPGEEIRLRVSDDKQLEALEYEIDAFNKLVVSRPDSKLKAKIVTAEKEIRLSQSSGTIEDSLYLAAGRGGMSDNVIMQLVEIFGWDIDFALEIRKGDRFAVIYEEILRDGAKVRDGRIVAAEFVNKKNVHRAFYFDNNKIRGGYYDPDGRPMRKAFLRAPVKFSRISSGFSKKRWHPKLKKWRSHKGTDYAAPTGTPIRTTGDGHISYIGWMSGYGKVVMIKHANKYQTVYGHMSRFAPKLKKGTFVKQGKIIGYVGQTGLATGPHLHYETRVNGKHKDPERIKFPKAEPLPKKYRSVYQAHTRPLMAKLDNLGEPMIALKE